MGATERRRPELIAPAGDMERLRAAIHFGADAVYLSAKRFSLRGFARNFTLEELEQAVALARASGVRVYLAVNSFLRNADLDLVRAFLEAILPIGFDALILSDPALLLLVRERGAGIPVHLSTQANTLNTLSARFWFEQGVRRIILARELSLGEIRSIREQAQGEIEVFVHGALCMAYSGRCLMSLYMADRDANEGLCAQACRWKYALSEEKRPGQFFPVEEDDRGSYILNSKDLCLLDCLPDLVEAGVDALKIEGRNKGIHYVASVVKAYRHALDRHAEDPQGYRLPPACREEVLKVSHRSYTTGFLLPRERAGVRTDGRRDTDRCTLVGVVREAVGNGWYRVEVRNRLREGDALEQVGPAFPNRSFSLDRMRRDTRAGCGEAHAGDEVRIRLPHPASPGDLLRRREAADGG